MIQMVLEQLDSHIEKNEVGFRTTRQTQKIMKLDPSHQKNKNVSET